MKFSLFNVGYIFICVVCILEYLETAVQFHSALHTDKCVLINFYYTVFNDWRKINSWKCSNAGTLNKALNLVVIAFLTSLLCSWYTRGNSLKNFIIDKNLRLSLTNYFNLDKENYIQDHAIYHLPHKIIAYTKWKN